MVISSGHKRENWAHSRGHGPVRKGRHECFSCIQSCSAPAEMAPGSRSTFLGTIWTPGSHQLFKTKVWKMCQLSRHGWSFLLLISIQLSQVSGDVTDLWASRQLERKEVVLWRFIEFIRLCKEAFTCWNEQFLSMFPKIMRCRYCEPSVYRWEILGLEKLWKFVQLVLESVRLFTPKLLSFLLYLAVCFTFTHRRVILWYMCYCSAGFWACSASSTGHFTY